MRKRNQGIVSRSFVTALVAMMLCGNISVPEVMAAEPEEGIHEENSDLADAVIAEAEKPVEEQETPDYEGWDTIKVFETTDVHGYITDVSTYEEETFQYRMAYIANIINQARVDEAYDDVLLLDSGDIYQGTPHSNLTYGAALRAAYDEMGYDAVDRKSVV